MTVKCNRCSNDITSLSFREAVASSPEKIDVPDILITLACPHCKQAYYTAVPIWSFQPVEVKSEIK